MKIFTHMKKTTFLSESSRLYKKHRDLSHEGQHRFIKNLQVTANPTLMRAFLLKRWKSSLESLYFKKAWSEELAEQSPSRYNFEKGVKVTLASPQFTGTT